MILNLISPSYEILKSHLWINLILFIRETMIEHLEIPSTIVHINSTEGKKQIQEEMEKSKYFDLYMYLNF